ncbi:porin [Caulifigura coniformis]|nr:porin [Caulifigura coniformis]
MSQAVPRKSPYRLGSLAVVSWLFVSRIAAGQELPAVSSVAIQPPPPAVYDPGDLARRLAEAEAKIRSLEDSQAEHKSLLQQAKDRWKQAVDPAITTVDQQTHGASTNDGEKQWYERISVRGYAQLRFNSTLSEEQDGAPPDHIGDSSVGDNRNFLLRRARLVFSGDVSDHLYVYLQPDFTATPPGSSDATFFAQVRDWYGDLYIDVNKVYRVRIGQSKIPFGWENMQSSSNRVPLDRNDGLNSSLRNERDLGVIFYWTPEEAQDLFKYVLDEGLKGSGNYGVFALGVYNGQGGATLEQNDNVHVVSRLAIPYQFENKQVMEVGVQGYVGEVGVFGAPIQPLGIGPAVRPLGTIETGERNLRDERVAATFVWYPQPLGFQAEWNVGRGPGLNDDQTRVVERHLNGGYAMTMYRHETKSCGVLFPFARFNYFEGGYKNEDNAPYGHVHEYEAGLEWQFNPQMELVTQYTLTDRTNTSAESSGESYRQFQGQLLRMQFQINY